MSKGTLWKFEVHWKEKEGKEGGTLPGSYVRSDGMTISRHLRKHYPHLLIWMCNEKPYPMKTTMDFVVW